MDTNESNVDKWGVTPNRKVNRKVIEKYNNRPIISYLIHR